MSRAAAAEMPTRLITLEDDAAKRTVQMLRIMAAHVDEALEDPAFVQHARWASSNGRGSVTPRRRAQMLLRHVQRRYHYVPDPVGQEMMTAPGDMLALRAGDCNSLAPLLAAMYLAVGLEARLETVGDAPDRVGSHVYVLVAVNGRWLAADPSPYGQGPRARYLALGEAPGPAWNHLGLGAADPDGELTMGSWLSHGIGEVLEQVRDLATLKYPRKALQYSWRHMGGDMRKLITVIGPMVAEAYAPGFGGTLAKAALSALEQDRLARKARHALKKAQEAKQLPAELDLDNPTHLEAIYHAGTMPTRERNAWLRAHGYPVPASKRGLALVAAAVAALVLL